VRKAKISLDVSVQQLSHRKLRQGLLEARRRGAQVRVIVDAGRDGFPDLPGRGELDRAGIDVRMDQTSRTMHHKFAVIDKKCIINGSLNWTNAVYRNMESVVISKSASLAAAFGEEFDHLWLAAAARAHLPRARARFSASGCEVLLFPDAARQNLQLFLDELRTARRTLDVCVFSLWLCEAVDTMCELQRRGVTVRVISDKRHAANHGGRLARRELQKAGIEYLVDKLCGEMHHKFAVIDRETVVCGSLNWSRAAVAGNTENIVFYRNLPSLASRFTEEFESLRLKCRRPTSKASQLQAELGSSLPRR
jgi:phosphatidylserine/phosphatidylglycerophosphate/cardiolipin synthase-like enzyme